MGTVQQQLVVSFIGIGSDDVGIFRVPGRADARRSTKRIHHEAGIIGDQNLSRNMPAVELRLKSRVLFKRSASLFGGLDRLHAWQRQDVDIVGYCSGGKIRQLTRIGTRDEDS